MRNTSKCRRRLRRRLVEGWISFRAAGGSLSERRYQLTFVGLSEVRKQRWHECPKSFSKRMQVRPRVATRDKWRRIEALTRNKQFEIDHAEALAAWREGNRDVVFPAGTYKMRVVHGVRCREQQALL